MTLKVISRKAFARELSLLADDGTLAERGVATLLRQPLARWGLSPKRAVLRFAREQVAAAGLANTDAAKTVRAVLGRLQALGECQEVLVGDEPYLAPCTPRWVPTGDGTGALLSVTRAPPGVNLLDPSHSNDIVTRIRIGGEEDLVTLQLAGVRTTSLDEWLRPLGYLRHTARRRMSLVRDSAGPLEGFWEFLLRAAGEESRPLGDDADVRILSGAPGSFFGRDAASECEGRWSREAADGLWCAYRRGYGDAHWHRCLISIDSGERRVLDLYNHDEWCWALLARGLATGAPECVVRDGARLSLTFPAPSQLHAAMDLLGPRVAAWSWEVSPDAPNPWRALT